MSMGTTQLQKIAHHESKKKESDAQANGTWG
jgi:hypothetical protein